MATHSSVLAWRIPGIGEPGGLPSMGSHRVRHNRSDLAAAAAICLWASQVVLVVKNPPANVGDIRDARLLSGAGKILWRRAGNSLQCSCLENPMDRGAWWGIVHRVAKSWTRLKQLTM